MTAARDPSDATRLFVREELSEATKAILAAEERMLREMEGRISVLEANQYKRMGAENQKKSTIVVLGVILGAMQIISGIIIALIMKQP